jgi:hypothetical protein
MAGIPENSLSKNQERALAALISQPTIPLAAVQAKVGERTLFRWLNDDGDFKAEYLRLRRKVVNNAVFQIQKASNNAVNCLISVLNDSEAPASARVSAARMILEMSFEALKFNELEGRIAKLEDHLQELGIQNRTNGRPAGNSYRR